MKARSRHSLPFCFIIYTSSTTFPGIICTNFGKYSSPERSSRRTCVITKSEKVEDSFYPSLLMTCRFLANPSVLGSFFRWRFISSVQKISHFLQRQEPYVSSGSHCCLPTSFPLHFSTLSALYAQVSNAHLYFSSSISRFYDKCV